MSHDFSASVEIHESSHRSAYSNNDGWLGGELVRHINVHLKTRRVGAEAGDLFQGRAGGQTREGGKVEEGFKEHGGQR